MDAGGGRDLAVVARWLFSWALALSRQGSQHQQVIHADIRKSFLAKCTGFTPVMTVTAEGCIVPCHYTGNECTLKLERAGSSRTLVPAYQTTGGTHHSTQQLSFSTPRESQILNILQAYRRVVFWDVTSYSLVDVYRSFRRICSQGKGKLLAWRNLQP
jgi:hypothetical protein